MIRDFSTMYWGYLPSTRQPYPVHAKVNAFIGPSGHGKTTIWDALRLMLGTSHFESKREFYFYVNKPNNWAIVRVAFHNRPINGVRPFEMVRKFQDAVTACCRIYKTDQGAWTHEYYLFDGEFHDLADLQLNPKAYSQAVLGINEYQGVLEQCLGITKEFRNLMAMSPDTIRNVVNSSPRALFHLIFDLKGAKEYKQRYDNSKQRLNEQQIQVVRTEKEMEEARTRFAELEQKAKKYQLFHEKEREAAETALRLGKLLYFEAAYALEEAKHRLTETDGELQNEMTRDSELTVMMKGAQRGLADLDAEMKELESALQQADADSKRYLIEKTKKESEAQALEAKIAALKQLEPQDEAELEQLLSIIGEELEEKRQAFSEVKHTLEVSRKRKGDLERNVSPYRAEAVSFRNALQERHIPFIMLADAIQVKPEMKRWQESIEAYLGNERYRIIVERKDYLPAKKLQERLKYNARVCLPKPGAELRAERRIPYPSIRSAIVNSAGDQVEGYLDRLNRVYLVETVEQGHELQIKGVDSITLGGLLQDHDGSIHRRSQQLCCGSLAIEEEKKRVEALIKELEGTFENLRSDISKLKAEEEATEAAVQEQQQLRALPLLENAHAAMQTEWDELERQDVAASQKCTDIKEKDRTTRKARDQVFIHCANFDAQQQQVWESIRRLKKQMLDQERQLENLVRSLQKALGDVKGSGATDEEIALIPQEIQGAAYFNEAGLPYTSRELGDRLTQLERDKASLRDPSASAETVRLVKAQQGHVDALDENLKRLKTDRDALEQTCDDLLHQFKSHIKQIMKAYISEFEALAGLLKASVKGRLVEKTPEPETWEIELYIGYDGKEAVSVDGPHLSSGQKACTSLMLILAAVNDRQNGKLMPIMFLDEPKARVDDERGNEIGQLLQITDIQYFITHQQGEALKSIDWIDYAFTCSAVEPGKQFASQLILKKRRPRY